MPNQQLPLGAKNPLLNMGKAKLTPIAPNPVKMNPGSPNPSNKMMKPVTKRLMSDAEIKRRKKLQGHISVTTSTLGLTALGLKGVSAAAPKIARLGAKGAEIGARADKAATNTLIGSAGIGGLGGYNFAAYTNAESRKRKTPTVIKKEHTMMDFGPTGVVGEASKAEIVRAEGIQEVSKKDWMNIEEHQRRSRDSRRTYNRGKKAAGWGGTAIGGAALHHSLYASRKPDPFTQAKTAVGGFKNISRHYGLKTATQVAPKIARANPHGSAVLAGGALIAGGAATMAGARVNEKRHDKAIARQRKERVKKAFEGIEKAYDPERNRQRRLDHYSTAAAAASGGAGAAAAHFALQAKKGGVLKLPKNPVFGPGVRAAGKSLGLAAAAGGAAVASDRIRRYKKGRGQRYTALRPVGY